MRENGHETIADQLDQCQVVFKCYRTIGVQNAFGSKKSRTTEEMVATTFYKDLLGDILPEIKSDELSFNIYNDTRTRSPSPRSRCNRVINATSLIYSHSPCPKKISEYD